MKLTLSHDDVISGICAFLEGRGLTGFDPKVVSAEFTKGRDGKLSVVLDDEAPVAKVIAEKAEEVKQTKASATASTETAAPASTTGASATEGGANAAAQAEPLSEAGEAPKGDAVAESAAEPANTQAAASDAAATGGEAENLFG